MVTSILTGLFILFVGLWLYVRLAPTDVARWHMIADVRAPVDRIDEGGFFTARRMTAPASDVLAAVAQTAEATDRTALIAGSLQDGILTYQTRSRLWGFPDHTTIAVQGDLLVFYGRLRFGRSDLGVNKARVEKWLAVLGPLTEPL